MGTNNSVVLDVSVGVHEGENVEHQSPRNREGLAYPSSSHGTATSDQDDRNNSNSNNNNNNNNHLPTSAEQGPGSGNMDLHSQNFSSQMGLRPGDDAERGHASWYSGRFSQNSVQSGESNRNDAAQICKALIAWCQLPHSWRGHFLSVDLTSRYRRHLVWAKHDGEKLLQIVVARYQVTTVFCSLLLSADLAVFFSPSNVVEEVRVALEDGSINLKFATGIALSISIVLSLSALIANFTAWSVFVVLSRENAGIILRSSLGLYSAQLPSLLVVFSIYLFFLWIILFWCAVTLSIVGVLIFGHIASTYSAVGQVIIATSAMSSEPILPVEEEEKLSPGQLYDLLVRETQLAKKANVPINRQYRMKNVSYHEHLHQQELHDHLHEGSSILSARSAPRFRHKKPMRL